MKQEQKTTTPPDYRRIACGIFAVGFAVAGVSLNFLGVVSAETGSWLLGPVGKVAILLAFVWLAWPQIIWLSQLPGGGIAMIALAVGGLFFLIRPRAMLYVIPGVLGVMLLFVAIGFVQRYIVPPK